MAEITQVLGFDASGAIATISSLNTSLQTLTANLTSVSAAAKGVGAAGAAKSFKDLNTQAKAATTNINKTASAGKNAGTAMTNGANGAASATNRLSLSWETLGRVVLTQVVVRAFSSLTRAMQEGIKTARDLNLAVAEAVAISPRGIGNFQGQVEELNASLRATSRAFGFDVLDLAEAKYQEYSNQVKGSAESNELFIQSNRLARISSSSVAESVGALSSVLNSYGQDVSGAERASAQLFKTIELGRTRLTDIADQIGNVTPLARAAGVQFEELGASIATITTSGVSPSRALTQIRALLNQLQKPTDELQAAFESLGVAGIEEAVQQFGDLSVVVQKLQGYADDTGTSVAAMFSNIRARNAFISLNQQSESFAENLREIEKAGDGAASFIDGLIAQFDQTDAVQFNKAINDLNVTMTELGSSLLPVVTGAITGLNDLFGSLGGVLTAVSAGLALYTGWTAKAAASTIALGTATKGAYANVLTFGAAIGVFAGLQIVAFDTARALGGLAEKAKELEGIRLGNLEKLSADSKAAAGDIRDSADATVDLANRLRELNRQSNPLQAVAASNRAFVNGISSSLQDLITTRTNYVRSLESAVQNSEDTIAGIRKRSATVQEQLDDRIFENRIRGLTDYSQARERLTRAESSFRDANRNSSNTPEDLQARIDGFEKVIDLAEEASDAGREGGSRSTVLASEGLIARAYDQQLKALQAQEDLTAEGARRAADKLADERANLEELKSAAKTLQENLSLFDNGQVVGDDERIRRINASREAFAKIQELRLDGDNVDTAAILGSVQDALQFNKLITDVEVAFPFAQAQLNDKLSQIGRGASVDVDINFINKEAGIAGLTNRLESSNTGQSAIALARELEKEQLKSNTALAKYNELQLRTQDNRELIAEAAKEITEATEFAASQDGASNTARYQERVAAAQRVADILNNLANKEGVISEADLQRARELLVVFDSFQVGGDLPGLGATGAEEKFIGETIDLLREKNSLTEEAIKLDNASQSETGEGVQQRAQTLENINGALQEGLNKQSEQTTKERNLQKAINETRGDVTSVNTAIGQGVSATGGVTSAQSALGGQIAQNINAANQLTRALAAAASAGAGAGGTANAMFGKTLYRAGGGFAPRGTDTIPAMISPGETVINARSSRQFASQLNAINSGVNPAYRSNGGTVNNNSVSVGDINVNGSADPGTTARKVASELRREFRRGTSSRFN